MSKYPCPVCGFLVFEEEPGSYENCPICEWEDDDVQLRYPTLKVGANKESLCESQQALIQRIPPDVREYEGYQRDLEWKPLKEEECISKGKEPTNGLEYFQEAGEGPPPYYWRKK